MKRINISTLCPCGNHVGVQIKTFKPLFLSPIIAKSKCPECESEIWYTVTLAKNRTTKNQIFVIPVNIEPTEKLIEILEARDAAVKAAQPVEPSTTTEAT